MYAKARISLLYLFYVCLHSYGNMSERRDGGVRVRRGRSGSGAWKGEGTSTVASAVANAVAKAVASAVASERAGAGASAERGKKRGKGEGEE
jgi:hypothetical protein